MKTYDFCIIGSGLGSLLCASILSREGNSVLILEKNSRLGGLLQSFSRHGISFDTGVHYIGSLEPGQILYQYFNYFNLIEKIQLKRLDKDAFDVIYFRDDKYKYAQGKQGFVDSLSKKFPAERKNIQKYLKKINQVAHLLPLHNLKGNRANLMDSDFVKVKAWDYIRSITSNPKLQHVLAATNPLYSGIKDKTPLYTHALINHSFIESAWRLVGGSGQIVNVLSENICRQGGDILTNKRVNEFIFNGNTLCGVKTSNQQQYFAKNVISGIHPAHTMDMIPEGKIRPVFKKRIKNLQDSISLFMVFIKFKKNTFPYLNQNHYYYQYDSVWTEKNIEKMPGYFLMITPPHIHEPVYAQTGIVLTYMPYTMVEKWADKPLEKRGTEYELLKTAFQQKLLSMVEQVFPGFQAGIEHVFSASPLTWKDYTGTRNGAPYGVLKDADEPLTTFLSPRTKIPNLFLTGQSLNLHGVFGVTISSILTCAEILGFDYLLNKIKNA